MFVGPKNRLHMQLLPRSADVPEHGMRFAFGLPSKVTTLEERAEMTVRSYTDDRALATLQKRHNVDDGQLEEESLSAYR
jgi:hypothetical protein